MSKLLVVFGATGKQGGSVISFVLKNLASEYKIRGITRNVNSPKALALKNAGVDVVAADISQPSTVEKALEGADVVFSVSVLPTPEFPIGEFEQGKIIAELALKQRVKYLVWSTLPDAIEITRGRFRNITHFNEKVKVAKLIKGLPVKSAFVEAGAYFQNLVSTMKPVPIEGGSCLFNVLKPEDKFAWLDVVNDFGFFVGTILSSPEKHEGKSITASNGYFSIAEVVHALTLASGKNVKYVQISDKEFKAYLPPYLADDFLEMFKYFSEYAFEPDRKKVKDALEEAGLESLSAEEYVKRLPPTL